jgi:hypothetical protein
MSIRFQLKENSYGASRSGIPGCVAAPGAFNWFRSHMDLRRAPALSTRTRTNVRGDANKCSDFGKNLEKGVHNLFTKNFSKTLDFVEIPAYSTIVGRTF